MAKIKLYYRSRREFAPITMRFSHKANSYDYDFWINSTIIVPIKYWDKETKVVKKKNNESRALRNQLDNLEDFLIKEFGKKHSKGKAISKDWLEDLVEIHFNRKNENRNLTFIEYYENYIERFSKNPLPSTKKPLAKSSIKTYKSALNLIKEFHTKKYKLSFDKITLDFYEDYLEFLYEKDYSNYYIGTQIKTLKTIMNASFEEELHSNVDYKKRAFQKLTDEVFNIYLNEQELEMFYNADISKFKPTHKTKEQSVSKANLERTKDIFLIGSYTGLRVSDLNQLSLNNIKTIKGEKYLNIKTQKTGKLVTIPLHPIVKNIFKKYGNQPPRKVQPQTMNCALKVLGELAEINEPTTKEYSRGGLKVIETKPKYSLISNHTARRSFCTNAYLSGMNTLDIMAISTHTSEKTLLNYIKVTPDERAINIGKHDFFKQSFLKKV